MLRGESPDTAENAALAVGSSKNSNRGEPHNNWRGNLWCDHCQRSNHNKENCWRLHGKPPNWRDNRGNRCDPKGFQAMTGTATS